MKKWLLLFSLVLLTLFTQCKKGANDLLPATDSGAQFAYGAEVSWLPQMEAENYVFKNTSGAKEDCLQILKELGVNTIKLSTWVNPSNDPISGHQSQSETVAMATRSKAMGYKLFLSFQFGDTWNDVDTQGPPEAWVGMDYNQLKLAIGSYVTTFMSELKNKNATPDWVSIGNEVDPGVCLPVGSLKEHPDQMVGLLNTAYDAVKAVSPDTKVVIHLGISSELYSLTDWFDAYIAKGGKWDVTGLSTHWKTLSNTQMFSPYFKVLQARYKKPVMAVESGAFITDPNVSKDITAYIINYLKNEIPQGQALGYVYWMPMAYEPFNTTVNIACWDPITKQPTVAFDPFKYQN